MPLVYWTSDGAGASGGKKARVLNNWIRTNGHPSLIVYGGDVYQTGTPDEFDQFFTQVGTDGALLCETPGNHDWKTTATSPATGRIPSGYEAFWKKLTPPLSKQPIDGAKKGGARYEHLIDLGGWRLIFLDTGAVKDSDPWPMGDPTRLEWLNRALTSVPGRSKIVLAHHSRLSAGLHGDNRGVDPIWKNLFDPATGKPLVALTLGGHDHNVSVYSPRSRDNPATGIVSPADGIHVIVNGAGGDSHYDAAFGTRPDMKFDFENYCVTRINLIDSRSADVDVLSFGNNPKTTTTPKVLDGTTIKFRF